MESSIDTFCKGLAAFCNHLEGSCSALKQAVERRPIPLDSASTTFIQGLNRRVTLTGSDLSLLESMSFDTVSFEELLGHCNQVLNKNQIDILALQDHLLSSSSYVLPSDSDGEEVGINDLSPQACSSTIPSHKLDDDLLLDDSTSLRNLGLSDACLATIASEDFGNETMYHQDGNHITLEADISTKGDDLILSKQSESQIHVSKEEFDELPKFMKSFVSWEELLDAVKKMNSSLKIRSPESNALLNQDELNSLGLGSKAKSFLLLLIKMKCVAVETVDGEIQYKIL